MGNLWADRAAAKGPSTGLDLGGHRWHGVDREPPIMASWSDQHLVLLFVVVGPVVSELVHAVLLISVSGHVRREA